LTISLTLRPKSLDSWSEWETVSISCSGFLPIYHAGNNLEQIRDLDDLGGRKTMRRFISPASNCLSFSDITSICLPILKSETSVGAICLTKLRKSSLDSCCILCFNKRSVFNKPSRGSIVSIVSIVSMILYPYSILLYVIICFNKKNKRKTNVLSTKYFCLYILYIIIHTPHLIVKSFLNYFCYPIMNLVFFVYICHTYIYNKRGGVDFWGGGCTFKI